MAILIGILISIAVGILPMVVYALILWWFDRYEKEPVALLVAAFLWGAVPAIIFSLIAQLILDIPIQHFIEPMAADLIGAALIAPLTEEIFKGGALLLLLLFFRKEIDSPLDGIIYGSLVGFGFAAVENVLYFVSSFAESGPGGLAFTIVFRAFVFGLNHALFTGLTGLGLSLARISRNWLVKIGAPIVGLSLGMLAHGVHNASVSFPDLMWPCLITFASNWLWTLFMLVIVIWTTARERQWIVTFLADEVQRGTLSQEDYDVACSYFRRVSARTSVLFRGQFSHWWRLGRYYRLATELAFNKRRLTQFPEEQDTRARIDVLRSQVMDLAKQLA